MSEEQIEQVKKDLESVLDTLGWPKTIEKASLESRKVAVQYFIVSLNEVITPLRVELCN
jgi:hypothetical protein